MDEAEQEHVCQSVGAATRVVLGTPLGHPQRWLGATARNSIKQRQEAKQAGQHCGDIEGVVELSRIGREKRRKRTLYIVLCSSAATSLSCPGALLRRK
jgi:hypothetical protein